MRLSIGSHVKLDPNSLAIKSLYYTIAFNLICLYHKKRKHCNNK